MALLVALWMLASAPMNVATGRMFASELDGVSQNSPTGKQLGPAPPTEIYSIPIDAAGSDNSKPAFVFC